MIYLMLNTGCLMLVVKSARTRGVPAAVNFILNFVLNLLESVQNKAQKLN